MSDSVEEILGASYWAGETRRRVAQVARHRYSVVITGPPGSGKRFVANVLHRLSPRAARPMVSVDCSVLGEQSFASQLFGHEPGAFAGLAGGALGSFRAADGGTLFLGRVEMLPIHFQPPLLEALKTGRVRPIGAEQSVAVDVRLICSTLCDLQKEVQSRRLLPDLYAHLDAISLSTVPLATRPEDIEILSRHFLAVIAEDLGDAPRRLGSDALRRLLAYPWPENVAQLRTALERAAVLAEDQVLKAQDFDFLPEIS